MGYPGKKHHCKRGEPREFLRALVGHQGSACVLWPYGVSTEGYGYTYVGRKWIAASRLICILAHGEPYSIWNEASHSCGQRLCVNPNRLSWKNKAGNAADRLAHGTHHRGANSPRAKLTWDQVAEIRSSKERPGVLAAKFGVAPGHIYRIRMGTRWSEPKQPETRAA